MQTASLLSAAKRVQVGTGRNPRERVYDWNSCHSGSLAKIQS